MIGGHHRVIVEGEVPERVRRSPANGAKGREKGWEYFSVIF
jgi:hypothetical protein